MNGWPWSVKKNELEPLLNAMECYASKHCMWRLGISVLSYFIYSLSGYLGHFRNWNKLNLLLHVGHYFTQDFVSSPVGMGNSDGDAVGFSNSNQPVKLLFDKFIVLEMVDKNIPFPKWQLQNIGRIPANGFFGRAAVDKI